MPAHYKIDSRKSFSYPPRQIYDSNFLALALARAVGYRTKVILPTTADEIP